jgi:hypothetical protein
MTLLRFACVVGFIVCAVTLGWLTWAYIDLLAQVRSYHPPD